MIFTGIFELHQVLVSGGPKATFWLLVLLIWIQARGSERNLYPLTFNSVKFIIGYSFLTTQAMHSQGISL